LAHFNLRLHFTAESSEASGFRAGDRPAPDNLLISRKKAQARLRLFHVEHNRNSFLPATGVFTPRFSHFHFLKFRPTGFAPGRKSNACFAPSGVAERARIR
jgi:hypothetical protein